MLSDLPVDIIEELDFISNQPSPQKLQKWYKKHALELESLCSPRFEILLHPILKRWQWSPSTTVSDIERLIKRLRTDRAHHIIISTVLSWSLPQKITCSWFERTFDTRLLRHQANLSTYLPSVLKKILKQNQPVPEFSRRAIGELILSFLAIEEWAPYLHQLDILVGTWDWSAFQKLFSNLNDQSAIPPLSRILLRFGSLHLEHAGARSEQFQRLMSLSNQCLNFPDPTLHAQWKNILIALLSGAAQSGSTTRHLFEVCGKLQTPQGLDSQLIFNCLPRRRKPELLRQLDTCLS